MVIQQLLFMLILAYLQIDLCLFCAIPAVNKDIWRIISILKRKALLPLPIAHFFLLHFRSNVCSTGKVSNGKLRDELNLKCLIVPWVSIDYQIYARATPNSYCLYRYSELVLQNMVPSKTPLRTPWQSHSQVGMSDCCKIIDLQALVLTCIWNESLCTALLSKICKCSLTTESVSLYLDEAQKTTEQTWDLALILSPTNCSYKQLLLSITYIFSINSS